MMAELPHHILIPSQAKWFKTLYKIVQMIAHKAIILFRPTSFTGTVGQKSP